MIVLLSTGHIMCGCLTSMWALRASASVADVRLERKMRFEYAKLKARGRLRRQRVRYAPATQDSHTLATPVAASSQQALAVSSPTSPITGEKRHRQQVDPVHDVHKRPRRTVNPAIGNLELP